MSIADTAHDALRLAVAGDRPAAVGVLAELIQGTDGERTAFVVASCYAAVAKTVNLDEIDPVGGHVSDGFDLARTMIATARTGDAEGALLVWTAASGASCGAALGALLAAAAAALRREMGL